MTITDTRPADDTTVRTRTAAAFTLSGVLFALFPILRPWTDETAPSTALVASYGSTRWILAHLCGIAGLTLLAPALLGLRALVAGTAGRGAATWALGTAWAGAALTGLYFGAEMFGIHTIAHEVADPRAVFDAVEALRLQPVAAAVFAVGLALLAAAGVLAAFALARSGRFPRTSGVVLAVAVILVLPQFWGGPALRIAHGVLYAVGCALAAYVLSRPSGKTARSL